jgi:hypothetical protein
MDVQTYLLLSDTSKDVYNGAGCFQELAPPSTNMSCPVYHPLAWLVKLSRTAKHPSTHLDTRSYQTTSSSRTASPSLAAVSAGPSSYPSSYILGSTIYSDSILCQLHGQGLHETSNSGLRCHIARDVLCGAGNMCGDTADENDGPSGGLLAFGRLSSLELANQSVCTCLCDEE